MTLHLLRHDDLAVVVDDRHGVPAVVHWGPDPGAGDLGPLLDRPRPPATLDVEPPATLVPLAAAGWPGAPGFEAAGPNGPLVPRWAAAAVTVDGATLSFTCTDPTGLTLRGRLELDDVLAVDLAVTNDGDGPVWIARLAPTLPLPAAAAELLRFDGNWCHEFHPRRTPWAGGTHVVDTHRGRTSHDRMPLVFAGTPGFDESRGDVRGVHVAWSGNHQIRLDRLGDGRRLVQAGEVLLAGEVRLAPGETYEAPTVLGVAGAGVGACSRAFHRHVRLSLPDRPRPVLLNTWEAVYFDHDLDRLKALADRAADIGVERFVLDDGWFGGRRDDTAGLGDWWVSSDAHPDGLGPLIDHVTGLGMEFGIWVEPEMVNADSDLYRAHPDWVLGTPDLTGRNQLVLDLSIPDCSAHLFEHLDRLLADHAIAYVKWDMNRDLAGAGAHAQTVALYALLDRLRDAHPSVEFESCASGGGRADLGILARTERIWTSDCNDALERQTIQRGFSHLFPPEVMGAHIGPTRAHTTGRTSRLAFRAATALFGHLGIEWNLLDAEPRHLDALRAWIALHKRLRPLLHAGDVIRLDRADPDGVAHGVVDADRAHAVFSYAQLTTPAHSVPAPLVLAGLDPDRTYRVERIAMPGEVLGLGMEQPRWVTGDGVEATGRSLMSMGLPLPILLPESAVLLELT